MYRSSSTIPMAASLSLNDVAIISPRNKELCSTDVAYIVVQVFRPELMLHNQRTSLI